MYVWTMRYSVQQLLDIVTVCILVSLLTLNFVVIHGANASALTNISLTMDDSIKSTVSDWELVFTTPTGFVGDGTTNSIKIVFDADGASPAWLTGTVLGNAVSISVAGVGKIPKNAGTCGVNGVNYTFATGTTSFAGDTLTLIACSGQTVSAGSKVSITLGYAYHGSGDSTLTTLDVADIYGVQNPVSTGEYLITITAGNGADVGFTRAVITNKVNLAAEISAIFTLSISGVATGAANINEATGTTDIATNSSSLAWGTLAVAVAKQAGMSVVVSTNAIDGFRIYVVKDGELRNDNSDTIDIFKDGTDASASSWTNPSASADTPSTFGHWGVTSDDNSLGGSADPSVCATDTFGTALYDAVPTVVSSSPASLGLEIRCDTSPTSASTTSIGFQIQISSLQESGTYTNRLWFVSVPQF